MNIFLAGAVSVADKAQLNKYSTMYDKKMIFCYQKGSYVSSMITGTFCDAVYIEYENLQDLKNKLSETLNKLQ